MYRCIDRGIYRYLSIHIDIDTHMSAPNRSQHYMLNMRSEESNTVSYSY